MLDKLVFYNSCGAGDIFESREFIKDYMKLFPAKEYYYAHKQHPRILSDMPNLKYTKLEEFMNIKMPFINVENSLYINTWIGRSNKYVIGTGGCVVERLYEMHNEIIKVLANTTLPRSVYEYVPNIDFSYYDVSGVDKFIKTERKNRRIVLIDNGKVLSKQAENFDFTPVILRLAQEFRDIIFVITHEISTELPNIFTTASIIKSKYNFDLNEIAYLSKFCGTLIGRCSGPHTFCQILDNWRDVNKALLSFTYANTSASFILNKGVFPMKKCWSGCTDTARVLNACIAVIERS
jgi:hypothetical protein